MAEQPSDRAGAFDVQRIHHLVRLMKRYDLTALDLKDGSVQVRLRRRPPGSDLPPVSVGGSSAAPVASTPAATSVAAPARAESSPTTVAIAPKTVLIESPMVGTYYSSSAPDTPAFVSVGSVVHPDTIVCIIEAMKVFTDIPAGVSGTIAAVLVNSSQAVEYGQALFRVIPS
jgi:acetyl-CoA carboxylase biotin carboxyl carrier protein